MDSLEPSDALLTISELSIAIVGFAGIVTVLQPAETRQLAQNRFRLRSMVEFALASLVYSLLPLVLLYSQVPNELSWSIASAALIIGLSGYIIYRRAGEHGIRGPAPNPSPRFRVFMLVGFVLVMLVQLMNIAGVVFPRSFTAYFIGLAWLLVISAIMFARIIFYSGAVDIRGRG